MKASTIAALTTLTLATAVAGYTLCVLHIRFVPWVPWCAEALSEQRADFVLSS